jgi:hypothetical protein
MANGDRPLAELVQGVRYEFADEEGGAPLVSTTPSAAPAAEAGLGALIGGGAPQGVRYEFPGESDAPQGVRFEFAGEGGPGVPFRREGKPQPSVNIPFRSRPAGAEPALTDAPFTGPTWNELLATPEYQQGSSEKRSALEREWLRRFEQWATPRHKKKADREELRAAIAENFQITKAPQATIGDRIGDLMRDVRVGGEQLIGSLGSLVRPGATVQDEDATFLSYLFNPARREEAAKGVRENFSAARKDAERILDERVQAAEPEGEFAEFGATLKAFKDRPSLAVGRAVQQIPNLLSILVPGAAAGRVATLAGATARAAGTTARGTAASISGSLGAGQARGQVAEALGRLTDQQWETDDEYLTLRDEIGTEAAKAKLIEDRSVMAGVVGAGLGVVAGLTGLERLLGPGAGRSLRQRAGRVAAELLGEEVEEITPTVLANVEARRFAPETGLAKGVGRTAAETLAAAGGPAIVSGVLPVRGEPGAEPAPAGEPPPAAPPAAEEPTTPETFMDSVARQKAFAESQLAAVQENPLLTPTAKASAVAALEQRITDWDRAAEEFQNTPTVKELRGEVERLAARQTQVETDTTDDATKAALLEPLIARQQRAEELLALNELSELDLEQYVADRQAALLDFDQQRGTGAKATAQQIANINEELATVNKILDDRASVETPAERSFAARERTAFKRDESGNPVYPTTADLRAFSVQDAFEVISDIAQSRIYDARTNRIYEKGERAGLIREARAFDESVSRARAILSAPDADVERLGADLKQGLVNLLRRNRPIGDGRINEMAAVISRQAQISGEEITWGDAVERATRTLRDLIHGERPPPPPTGPVSPPIPPGTPPTKPAPPKGSPKTFDTQGYAINTGAVGYHTGRNPKNADEAQRLIDALNAVSAVPDGFPKLVVQALGARFLVCTQYAAGWYWPSRNTGSSFIGQTALNLSSGRIKNLSINAHEIGHALDDVRRTGRYLSLDHPAFTPGGELRAEIEAYDRRFVRDKSLSVETADQDKLDFWYPLRYDGIQRKSDTETLELFAQIMGYYHSSRQDLAKYLPKSHAFAKDLFDGLRQLESAGQLTGDGIADVVSGALSRVGAAPGTQPAGAGEAEPAAVQADTGAGGGPAGAGVGAAVRPAPGTAAGLLSQEEADGAAEVDGILTRQTSLLGPERARERQERDVRAAIDQARAAVTAAQGRQDERAAPRAATESPGGEARADRAPAADRGTQPRAGPEGDEAVGQGPAPVVTPGIPPAETPVAMRAAGAPARKPSKFEQRLSDEVDRLEEKQRVLTDEVRKLEGMAQDEDFAEMAGEIDGLIRQAQTSLTEVEARLAERMTDLHYAENMRSKVGDPTSASRLTSVLGKLFGIDSKSVARLIPTIELVHTDEIDVDSKSIRMASGRRVGNQDGSTVAFYLPSENKLVFYVDNIAKGEELTAILHELFHKRGRQLLGRELLNKLRAEVQGWRNAPEGSIERRIYNEAMPRVMSATEGLTGKEKKDLFDEELIPYFISAAAKFGVTPDQKNVTKKGAEGWISRAWKAYRDVANKVLGRPIPAENFTVTELMAAAYGAAQFEPGAVRYELMGRGQRVAPPRAAEARAAAFLERSPQFAIRAEEIRQRRNIRAPEAVPVEKRKVGGLEMRGANPDAANPIYGTRAEIANANRQATPPGPGPNAKFSIYERFKPTEAAPIKTRASVKQWAQTQELPTAPWFPQARDRFVENWQDHQRPFMYWLRDNVLSMRPWQQLKLVPGKLRALTDRFTRDIIDPIAGATNAFAAKYKIPPANASEVVGQWTTMRHIPEANAQLRRKILADLARGEAGAAKRLKQFDETQRGLHPEDADPDRAPMAGGYTDAEANEIRAQLERTYTTVDLAKVGNMITDGFRSMRDEAVKSGQLSPQAVKNFPAFKHYVALTGTPWDDSASDAFGSYVAPNVLKERGGMRTHVADQALIALVDRVGRVAAYASSAEFKASINDLWQQNGGEKNKIGLEKLNSQSAQSPFDSDIIWQDPKDGRRYIFRFTGPAQGVGQALLAKNREYADNAMLRIMDRTTRLFSRAVTAWTMAFAPINMMRDVQEKATLIRSRGVRNAAGDLLNENDLFKRVWANSIKPELWKAASQIAFGGKASDTNASGRLANELVQNGGVSNFAQQIRRGREEIAKEIAKKSGIRKHIKSLDDWVTNYNTMFEVISSLSAHAAMREMGVESKDAAFQTLDLMNFNNQGAKTAYLRSMYSFFNPAVQSGANLWRQLGTTRGRRDALAMAFLYAGIYALAHAIAPDDEELGNGLDQRGSFEIERNVPIMLGGVTLKLPVGFGLNQLVWANVVNAARFMSGRYDAGAAVAQTGTSFLKTFSPIPPSEVEFTKQPNNFFVKWATPTVFRPVVDLATDTNAWGSKITPYFPDRTKFSSEQGATATPVLYKNLAREMREFTGIDAYPEQWRTFVEGTPLGWGPMGYLLKSMTQSTAELEGRKKDTIDEIPLSTAWRVLGGARFFGGTSRYLESRYHDQYTKAQNDIRELNVQKAAGKDSQWLRSNPERASRIEALKAQESVMRGIRQEYNAAIRGLQGGTLDLEQGQRQLAQIADRREKQMRDFLKLANQWDEEELGEPEEEE